MVFAFWHTLLICKLIWASLRGLAGSSGAKIQYKSYLSLIPQHYSLWGTFIYWSDIFGIYPLIWGFSGILGCCIVMKSPTQTNGEVWKTTKNTSITEYFAATSTFAQYRFGKFFKAQLWENVRNMLILPKEVIFSILIATFVMSDILFVFFVGSTKIGEISDISKCFENFCFSDTWSSYKNLCCGIKVFNKVGESNVILKSWICERRYYFSLPFRQLVYHWTIGIRKVENNSEALVMSA